MKKAFKYVSAIPGMISSREGETGVNSGVFLHTAHGGWPDEADATVEHNPAEDGEEQHGLAFPEAVGHEPPKWSTAELYEVADSNQQATLAGSHAQLFVVHSQERMEGAISRIEEEVEHL